MSLSTDSHEGLSASSRPVQESDQAGWFNQFLKLKSRFAVLLGIECF